VQDQPSATPIPGKSSFVRDLAMLFKLRLTLLVIISAVLSYYMGTDETNVTTLSALCIGGLLLTGGSNGLNQALEREWDKLMLRTQNRPIPTGRMSLRLAVVLSMTAGILGILILWYYCGTACGILGASAFILYVAFYNFYAIHYSAVSSASSTFRFRFYLRFCCPFQQKGNCTQ